MRLLRGLAFVLAVLPVMNGCAHTPNVGANLPNPGTPNTNGILRLMGMGSAHACPVADKVLTSAHVIDNWKPYRWSDGFGHEGIVDPEALDRCSDLAWLKVRSGEVQFYRLATKPPAIGDRLWLLGYDTSSKGKFFGPSLVSGKVVRIMGGHLFLDEAGKPGSSGSCVFDESGAVVGINSGGHYLDGTTETVGRVVGIYGPWLTACSEGK